MVTPHTMRSSMMHGGVHGMRQGLLQPTEKIGGILRRPYVPRGTKKLGNMWMALGVE